MRIKVIGTARLNGTSKKIGNSYDFIQVHYSGAAFGVEGGAAYLNWEQSHNKVRPASSRDWPHRSYCKAFWKNYLRSRTNRFLEPIRE